MAVSQYDKPSNYQLAPLPYEGMLNRRFQMWNKEQDAMLQMHEQLGALQGKISSYDVDPADKDSYEQFVSGYTPQIEEFAKGITGKSSLDPIMRGNWAKMISSAENHPTLQTFKYNKEQKDLARKNLEANRKNYTQFELEDAYEKIKNHKTIGPDGELKPYTAEGLYSKVDMTNKLLGWGNQVIAEYDEDFSALSDIEKAAKVTTLSKTKEGIMNKVMPVAWQDNEMRREALAYADIVAAKQYDQPMTEEQRTLEAQKYIADKLAATAGLQEFTKEEMSLVSTGKGSGSGKKDPYALSRLDMKHYSGVEGSELGSASAIKNKIRDLEAKIESDAAAVDNVREERDINGDVRYYQTDAKGVESDITEPYKFHLQSQEAAIGQLNRLKDFDLELRKKHGLDNIISEKLQDLYDNSEKASLLKRQIQFEAPPEEFFGPGTDWTTPGRVKYRDMQRARMAEQDRIISEAQEGIKKIKNDPKYADYKKAEEAYEKELAEKAAAKTQIINSYKFEDDKKNESRKEALRSYVIGKEIRDLSTNQPLEPEEYKEILELLNTKEGKETISYEGAAVDHDNMPIEIYAIGDKKYEVTASDAIMEILAENNQINQLTYGLDTKLNSITKDITRRGSLPIEGNRRNIDISFEKEDGTFRVIWPFKEQDYSETYLSREQFYSDYMKYVASKKKVK